MSLILSTETKGNELVRFLNSFDMKKLLELIESSPQSGSILLQTAINIIQDPTRVRKAIATLKQLALLTILS